MQSVPYYAVYDDDTPNRSPRMWKCPWGLFLALENTRVVRIHMINPFAGDTFDMTRVLPTDPIYPFVKKTGKLRSDFHNP